MLNVILIAIIMLVILVLIILAWKPPKEKIVEEEAETITLDFLFNEVQDIFNTILKTNVAELNLNEYESMKSEINKSKLRNALRHCSFGNIGCKEYIKEYIKDLLQKRLGLTEENIDEPIPFESPHDLTIQDKFEIILYRYKCEYGLDGLIHMIKENDLDREQYDESGNVYYEISGPDIEKLYADGSRWVMDFDDKMNYLSQRIYQMYKGHGVIDEVRDMRIDGISAGVSGIPEEMYTYGEDLTSNPENVEVPLTSYNSIWIMFSGKTIHMSCIGFKSQRELVRVAKNVYRYNNPGQLSAAKGFIVNEMEDGCRVVTMRPPFAESWGFWIRKFGSADKLTIEQLINSEDSWIAIQTLKWLIKGCRVLALTGGQGCGKTTMLASLIQFISPVYTLRIQELAPELNLRKAYPTRNIMSLRETTTVSGQAGLDVQKKTDGNVNILGEVASDEVASWAVQMAQVGSDMTMFTHHAKTASDLVVAFRNSIIRAGGGSNEKLTEELVASVLNFNLHLTKEANGKRHIVRITEIRPTKAQPYPTGLEDAEKEYYNRMTDRKTFETFDIVVWNNDKFYFKNPLSDYSIEAIKEHLSTEELVEFNSYLEKMYEACSKEA